MLVYITELSKYFILILMIFYTVDAFVAVFKRKASGMLYIRQEICLFLMQFFAYATICLKTGKVDYLFFYAILQLIIFSRTKIPLYERVGYKSKCSQYFAKGLPLQHSLCAISFSWCGKIRS